jgi:hypothetical protein
VTELALRSSRWGFVRRAREGRCTAAVLQLCCNMWGHLEGGSLDVSSEPSRGRFAPSRQRGVRWTSEKERIASEASCITDIMMVITDVMWAARGRRGCSLLQLQNPSTAPQNGILSSPLAPGKEWLNLKEAKLAATCKHACHPKTLSCQVQCRCLVNE